MKPGTIGPQAVLSAYRMTTMDYQGEFLFVPLTKLRKTLYANTIKSMITKWLQKQWLRDLSADSTREAAAHRMINKIQDPMVVCVLG